MARITLLKLNLHFPGDLFVLLRLIVVENPVAVEQSASVIRLLKLEVLLVLMLYLAVHSDFVKQNECHGQLGLALFDQFGVLQ